MTTNNPTPAKRKQRIYIVEPMHPGLSPALIRATHASHAREFASRSLFRVRFATQDDLEALMTQGVRVVGYTPPKPPVGEVED